MFTFQENKFKIVQKNFHEIKIVLVKKIFFGKVTGHNDHYIINMGGQRSKIGGNWPLASPYLQHWLLHPRKQYICFKSIIQTLVKGKKNVKSKQ